MIWNGIWWFQEPKETCEMITLWFGARRRSGCGTFASFFLFFFLFFLLFPISRSSNWNQTFTSESICSSFPHNATPKEKWQLSKEGTERVGSYLFILDLPGLSFKRKIKVKKLAGLSWLVNLCQTNVTLWIWADGGQRYHNSGTRRAGLAGLSGRGCLEVKGKLVNKKEEKKTMEEWIEVKWNMDMSGVNHGQIIGWAWLERGVRKRAGEWPKKVLKERL